VYVNLRFAEIIKSERFNLIGGGITAASIPERNGSKQSKNLNMLQVFKI